jgi:biopolymer transport protein TolR
LKKHKHLDFELNLIPFIDLLSVCICFLLLTAVWLNVGSMDVKQAIGGQAQAETKKQPTLWVHIVGSGQLNLELQDSSNVPAQYQKMSVKSTEFKTAVAQLKKLQPNLSLALIRPQAATIYEDIIDLMDNLKSIGLKDLGVVPL